MATAGRYNCRLSLNDFIGSNEELIIAAMKMATDRVDRRIFFILWFTSDKISDSRIKKFYSDYEDELAYIGTRLIDRKNNDFRDRVWFDIISEEDADLADQFRFKIVYEKKSTIEEIIRGVFECAKAVEFFNNKPEKKPRYISHTKRVK